jgi:hypothetical protein
MTETRARKEGGGYEHPGVAKIQKCQQANARQDLRADGLVPWLQKPATPATESQESLVFISWLAKK